MKNENDTPHLISIAEFLASVQKKYRVETIGGFAAWMRKHYSTSFKLSKQVWQEKIDEYVNRKVV